MNRKLREEWVKALRSGEYKQGKYALQRADKFCCLGVLCLVAEKLCIAQPARVHGFLDGPTLAFQPTHIKRQVEGYDVFLASLNDKGQSFAQVADWIEQNVPVTDEPSP